MRLTTIGLMINRNLSGATLSIECAPLVIVSSCFLVVSYLCPRQRGIVHSYLGDSCHSYFTIIHLVLGRKIVLCELNRTARMDRIFTSRKPALATAIVMDSGSSTSLEKTKTEKSTENLVRISESDSRDAERGSGEPRVVANMEEIALKALHIDDDPTLNPWTFRMFLIGEYFCLDLGDSV